MGWGELIMEIGYNKILVTTSPTRGEWFWRFMKGNTMWNEVVSRRYFDLYLEAFHAIWKALKRYWKSMESDQEIGVI